MSGRPHFTQRPGAMRAGGVVCAPLTTTSIAIRPSMNVSDVVAARAMKTGPSTTRTPAGQPFVLASTLQ
jgi:hypothetical protein